MLKAKLPISFITANYNNDQYLNNFFDSILSSSVMPAEIVMVDDGSSDESNTIINSYQIKFKECGVNLIICSLTENVGFANALNIAIDNSTEDFLLRIDPDDIILDGRLENQFQFLDQNSDVDVVGSNVLYFDSDSGEAVFQSNVALSGIIEEIRNGHLPLIHGSVLLRKAALDNCRYSQDCVPAEDYDLFCQLALKGCKFHNMREIYTLVRIHKSSVSNDLKLSTVLKYSDLRFKYWGLSTPKALTYIKYLHLRFYRNFLFFRGLNRYAYLILAIMANPKSLLKRLGWLK